MTCRRAARFLFLFVLAVPGLAQAQPGRLISAEPFAPAPAGATAWRIRYETKGTTAAGAAGVHRPWVIAPTDASAGPRDIIAWNHGTVGIVEGVRAVGAEGVRGVGPELEAMIRQGYVVVATDYPGLGTKGPHGITWWAKRRRARYSTASGPRGASRAREAGNRLMLWGHSQGGHASLWAGQRQKAYASEFLLVGIAAISPPTDLARVLDGMDPTAKGILTAYVLRSWSQVLRPSTLHRRRQAHRGIIDRATRGCVGGKTGFDQLIRVVTLKNELEDLDLGNKDRWGQLAGRTTASARSSRDAAVHGVSHGRQADRRRGHQAFSSTR